MQLKFDIDRIHYLFSMTTTASVVTVSVTANITSTIVSITTITAAVQWLKTIAANAILTQCI